MELHGEFCHHCKRHQRRSRRFTQTIDADLHRVARFNRADTLGRPREDTSPVRGGKNLDRYATVSATDQIRWDTSLSCFVSP